MEGMFTRHAVCLVKKCGYHTCILSNLAISNLRSPLQSRYVFVGRRTTISKQKDRQSGNGVWSTGSGPKPLTKVYTDEYCISVFKTKVSPDTLAPVALVNLYNPYSNI
jgi:hypothetical protein